MRELFVSLPAGCTETDLSNYLTSQCHELGLCQMDMNPVLSARVNTLKAFAFCEFASVEICDGVFDKLNNAEMGGGNLRFGRPKAYEQLQLAGQLPSQGGGAGEYLQPRRCICSRFSEKAHIVPRARVCVSHSDRRGPAAAASPATA